MSFQRSQSKVWFGAPQNSVYDNFYSLPTYYDEGKKSLQSIAEQHEESLSPKEDLKRSFLLWGSRKSPSSQSHKSQDSGFSDAETSPTLSANKKNSSSVSDDDANQRSPSASSRAATPPTVIRRPQKIPIYEEIASVKRLSFSAPSSPALDTSEMLSQLDGINFSSTSPNRSRSSCRSCKLKRSRVITKNSRSPRSLNSSESFSNYNNETVYLGAPVDADDDVMEEKSLLLDDQPAGTSTPKSARHPIGLASLTKLLPPCVVYPNQLLNGNFASVQSWLDSLRFGASSEIMSTLQSKSIETGCLVLTSATAYKMVKSLQSRVFALQQEFEAVETSPSESAMLRRVQCLTTQLVEFVASQEPKRPYYAQCPRHYKTVVDNLQTIREMVTDLKRLAGKIDVDDLEEFPIGDDLQLIKRYFLVTVRLMFKLLLSVIADSIEHAANEMVLRANLTHLMNLATNEFSNSDGLASLQDAVIGNSVVRVLLLVCLENQDEWTRALALRTLSAVCTTDETIQQFDINSGFEILRDTIVASQRGGQETKEAISCLASITGPWSRSAETNFKDLKDYAEDYIEAVTRIVEATESPQTMLICVAVLNNLSRLDALSVYSLIANQSVAAISKAYARQPRGEYTIFLLEQVTALLLNMSLNRKSHYHLTSKAVLNFVLEIFLSSHSKQLDGQAKVKAQRAVLTNVTKIMRQLEATSTNHDVEMVWTKINGKLNPHDASSTSFNISNNAKNVTKISIYSQETFF